MIDRKDLLKECNLPDTIQTSHCFNDQTHLTCCQLGPEARKYSDSTGNPIGKLSEKLSMNKDNLSSWCTCAGSNVCSFLAKKFNDGTHIKFMYNPVTGEKIYNPDEKAEFRKTKFNTHSTPGIFNFRTISSENTISASFFKSKWFWVVIALLVISVIISLLYKLFYVAVIIGVILLFNLIKKKFF